MKPQAMNKSDQEMEAWATFAGQFHNDTVGRFFLVMDKLISGGATTIHMLIQSAGGIVGDGLALHNYLKNIPARLITYNAGAVESIAVPVYLAGSTRRVSATAVFLVHKSRYPMAGTLGANALRSMSDVARICDKNIETILRSHIVLAEDQWLAHESGDLVMGAEAAVKCKLAHEVADFKPPHGAVMVNI